MSLMHWVVVLVIVALVFGPNRLGQMGKGLGEGIRNLRKGLAGEDEEPKKLEDGSKRV
ncbi:MAG: twin-arginine translocase TatA/TatE family subunit [Polyangiaceae bacterium]